MSKYFGAVLHTGSVARVVVSTIPESKIEFIVEESIHQSDLDGLEVFFEMMTQYTESKYKDIQWKNFIEFESQEQMLECHKQNSLFIADQFTLDGLTHNVGLYRMIEPGDCCIGVMINDKMQVVDIRDLEQLSNDYILTAVWSGSNLRTISCKKKDGTESCLVTS